MKTPRRRYGKTYSAGGRWFSGFRANADVIGSGYLDAPLLVGEGLDRPYAHPLLVVVVVRLLLVDERLVAVARVRRGRLGDVVLGRQGRSRRVFPRLRLGRQFVFFRYRRLFRVLDKFR